MERPSRGTVAAAATALCLAAGCTVGNHDLGSPPPEDDRDSATAVELGDPTAASTPHPHWEAVVLGGNATVFPGAPPGGGPDTAALLRIGDVSGEVTVFSDRPERISGELEVHELVTLWAGGAFGDDPPNAAVVNGGEVAAVELTGAIWDPTTSTIWFSTRPLGEPLEDWEPRGGPTQLFIDGFARPSSQVTDAVTQTNVKVLADAPAEAMGLTYQTMAHSISLDTEDAQQNAHSLGQLDGATTEAAIRKILAEGGS